MLDHLRAYSQLYLLIIVWFITARFGGPLIYGVLPLSVLLLRGREMYTHILFGFLMVLVFSDMDPKFVELRSIKTAKHGMMVAISLVMLLDRQKMQPFAGVFAVFLPFFVYALFPLLNGNDPIIGIQKTISYALLYLVIPNYVLFSFRLYGWDFVRNMILFILTMLLASYLIYFINPGYVSVGGRYRAFFGNPNGLGIFSFLVFILLTTALHINGQLFSLRGRIFAYAIIIYFIIECGSRTSLTAAFMFLIFSRFFSLSPFIGVVAFIAFLAVAEMISANLTIIVTKLGVQHYFRVETLTDGSGRYFAWAFAWKQINEGGYFLFGGGFGNDEWVMRHNYAYLRSMGHHGGVHNSYLTMWFNTGLFGVLIFLRSFFLIFVKAAKRVPIAFAVMFSCMFSALYESWITGSLNPFSIILVTIMTLLTEDEIVEWRSYRTEAPEPEAGSPSGDLVPTLAVGHAGR